MPDSQQTNNPAILFSDMSMPAGNPTIPRGFITHARSYFGFGMFYIFSMTASIIMQLVLIRSDHIVMPLTAFWTAPFVYTAGVLSLCLSQRRTSYGLLVGTMVMSIVAAAILGQISILMWIMEVTTNYRSYGYSHYSSSHKSVLVLGIIQVINGLILCIAMIVHASFTCYDCCWCCVAGRSMGPAVIYAGRDGQNVVTVVTSQPAAGMESQSGRNGQLTIVTPSVYPTIQHRPDSPDAPPYSSVVMDDEQKFGGGKLVFP